MGGNAMPGHTKLCSILIFILHSHAYHLLHLLNRLLRLGLTCTFLRSLDSVTNFSHVILPDHW